MDTADVDGDLQREDGRIMKTRFRSISDVLGSPFLQELPQPRQGTQGQNRVLRSTRIEDSVYQDLRRDDAELDSLEEACLPKLSTFRDLSRDIYQSFYSLNVRRNAPEELSSIARQFNAHIMDSVMDSGEYPTIKAACEGRQLPAYEAASEFAANVAGDLDQLLQEAGGDKKSLDTLEKLEQKRDDSVRKLRQLLEARDEDVPDPAQDQQIVSAANKARSQCEQAQTVSRMLRDNFTQNGEAIGAILQKAVTAAKDKAEETALILVAWGTGDTDGAPEQMKLDLETLDRVRKSPTLREVARHLGRFKEILAQARKNSYAYGRGEKYALELGGDLNRALSSEFALLATPETIPLFLRKLQRRALKQYRRREAIYKGCGDIICVLDESTSAKKDAPWGKAVALTLLDAAMAGDRKFALIHFSSRSKVKTDLFLPGKYTGEDIYAAAETFLGGSTDYETPLKEALRLMEQEGFENADVVFVTDGECELPEAFQKALREKQAAVHFTVTGVLLDVSSPGFSFSLEPFCDDIYRTSQLAGDQIVQSLVSKRAA